MRHVLVLGLLAAGTAMAQERQFGPFTKPAPTAERQKLKGHDALFLRFDQLRQLSIFIDEELSQVGWDSMKEKRDVTPQSEAYRLRIEKQVAELDQLIGELKAIGAVEHAAVAQDDRTVWANRLLGLREQYAKWDREKKVLDPESRADIVGGDPEVKPEVEERNERWKTTITVVAALLLVLALYFGFKPKRKGGQQQPPPPQQEQPHTDPTTPTVPGTPGDGRDPDQPVPPIGPSV